MAPPQAVWEADFPLETGIPDALEDESVRQTIRVSLGGRRVRLVLSNAYGDRPVHVGSASLALAERGDRIIPDTRRGITFGGRSGAVVPPGAPIVTDPIDLPVAALSRLTVTLHFPDYTPLTTFHWDGRQTGYIVTGDATNRINLNNPRTISARLFLSGVLVETPNRGSVVVIGDSITDGNGATPNEDNRWPDYLAERFVKQRVAVLNGGISGARLLADGMGVNALARFDRDVLSQPQVIAVIVLIGINDVAWPGTPFAPDARRPGLSRLVDGYRQLIARARVAGVRIVGATLPPFEGALENTPLDGYYHADKDKLRRDVNRWIRNSAAFDGVIDFDAILRDPAQPSRLATRFDSGDHLHPGDRGNAAMAGAAGSEKVLGQ
ncbi:MAG: SGNH/GDSL hydrolase family protein [Gammaproteobacteria bacterium]|nr:SGNH/GDSL hydrolase family protein [Gammaproteobacteria bacterium]